ncbi:MAG: diacylglyceryl transferase [Gammaproteobacteria bacterium]|nr:diacylglyceryl transferase [Gammaproteobacteria bacterium]
MEKIRRIFRVNSNYQLLIVNVVFAITGSLALYSAGYLLDLMGLNVKNMNQVLYWTLRIVLILPVYQILLILVGSLFGEFEYFWEMEKKIINRLSRK